MRIAVDANFLIYMIDRRTGGTRVDADRRAKLQSLLKQVEATRGKLVIPAPVLCEYLTNAGEAGATIVDQLVKSARVLVAPFDAVAAQECSIIHRRAWDKGGHKRAPLPKDADWQSIKVDWQVVAIAKVHSATVVTNDKGLCTLAEAAGLHTLHIDSMPLPEDARQLHLPHVPAQEKASKVLQVGIASVPPAR